MLSPISLLKPMDSFTTFPLALLRPFSPQDFTQFRSPKRTGSAPPSTEAIKSVPSDQLFVFKNAFTPTARKTQKSAQYVSPLPQLKVSPPISLLAMSDEEIFDFQMPNMNSFEFNQPKHTEYTRSASTGPQTYYDYDSRTTTPASSFEDLFFNDYEGDFKSPFHPLENAPECNYRHVEPNAPECNYAPMQLFNGNVDQLDSISIADGGFKGMSMDAHSMLLEQAFNQTF
jgi:hypothetical protein